MTTHITKTWFEDGKLITQFFEEKDIYKREWIGLTDEEITALKHNGERYISSQDFARAIEAKLKEKNNA